MAAIETAGVGFGGGRGQTTSRVAKPGTSHGKRSACADPVGRFSRLQLGRSDRDYAAPIAICALVRRLEMPTEEMGDHALTALLRDEITFHSPIRAVRKEFLVVGQFQTDPLPNFYQLNLIDPVVVRGDT